MNWYWIIIISVVACEFINCIAFEFFDEDVGMLVSCGVVYGVLWVLLWPVRRMRTYNQSKGYWEKNGVGRWKFFFGRQTRKRKDK